MASLLNNLEMQPLVEMVDMADDVDCETSLKQSRMTTTINRFSR